MKYIEEANVIVFVHTEVAVSFPDFPLSIKNLVYGYLQRGVSPCLGWTFTGTFRSSNVFF